MTMDEAFWTRMHMVADAVYGGTDGDGLIGTARPGSARHRCACLPYNSGDVSRLSLLRQGLTLCSRWPKAHYVLEAQLS